MLPLRARGMDLILCYGTRMSHAVQLKKKKNKKKNQGKIGSPSVNNGGSLHVSEEILGFENFLVQNFMVQMKTCTFSDQIF